MVTSVEYRSCIGTGDVSMWVKNYRVERKIQNPPPQKKRGENWWGEVLKLLIENASLIKKFYFSLMQTKYENFTTLLLHLMIINWEGGWDGHALSTLS